MIINGLQLLAAAPIKDMVAVKKSFEGTSYGLGEAGYDIRVKQDIHFKGDAFNIRTIHVADEYVKDGRFCLASAMEEFQMPPNLTGIVHDKSTWARRGLSVFNTVIEPGWNGFLTLELVYHGEEELLIPAGSGIAQVIFHEVVEAAVYSGKYQNQEDEPVPARESI
jgi:dCTP deaminase